jgi:hypothetical protein
MLREDFTNADTIWENGSITWKHNREAEAENEQDFAVVGRFLDSEIIGNAMPNGIAAWHTISKQQQRYLHSLELTNTETRDLHATVQEHFGDVPIHLMRVVPSQGEWLVKNIGWCIVTPYTHARSTQFTVDVKRKGLASPPAAPPGPATQEHANDDEDLEDKFYSYPIGLKLVACQLMYSLNSPENLEEVVRLASAMVLQPEEHTELLNKIDRGTIKIPKKSAMYTWCVKADWVSMLYQRALFRDTLDIQSPLEKWFYSQFGGDSSPQKLFDYMNGIEIKFIFQGGFTDIASRALQDGALKCFTSERRSMVPQVLGYGDTGAAQKFYRFVRSLLLDTGNEDKVLQCRRDRISCWLADQGCDIKAGDCAAPSKTTTELLKLLKEGRLDFDSKELGQGYFLPNSITIPEALHAIFGLLKDALESSEAWGPFEPMLRSLVTTIGDKMFRDRFKEKCLVPKLAPKESIKLMASFPGHRFDWRWEMAETVSTGVDDRWEILETYYVHEVMSNDDQLRGEGLKTLSRCLKNDPDDVEGVELMNCATSVLTRAVGKVARKFKGCKCHEHIHFNGDLSENQKQKALILECGANYCMWMGAVGCEAAHDLIDTSCDIVADASSARFVLLVARSSPTARVAVLSFVEHVKARWCAGFREKFAFAKLDPHRIAGLIGMYKGYSVRSCQELARRILEAGCPNNAHRVTVALFSDEGMVRQLRDFGAHPDGIELAYFPQLFVFCMRYAVLCWVGHYLEGRHRHISLQMSGSGNTTYPGLCSFKMRKPEIWGNLVNPRFKNFAAVHWRKNYSIVDLLSPICEPEEYKSLSYHQRMQKLYCYDTASQFKGIDHIKTIISDWAKALARSRQQLAIRTTPTEKLGISYLKARLEVGSTFLLPDSLVRLVQVGDIEVPNMTHNAVAIAFFGGERRSCKTSLGDLAFTIVDARPEKKCG